MQHCLRHCERATMYHSQRATGQYYNWRKKDEKYSVLLTDDDNFSATLLTRKSVRPDTRPSMNNSVQPSMSSR